MVEAHELRRAIERRAYGTHLEENEWAALCARTARELGGDPSVVGGSLPMNLKILYLIALMAEKVHTHAPMLDTLPLPDPWEHVSPRTTRRDEPPWQNVGANAEHPSSPR